jgi:anaerobic magnesium-protoporphyrin IX monomethyl ester cyclase
MTDCLIIGFNDSDFNDYVRMVEVLGTRWGAYRDLALAFVEEDGTYYRALDILSRLHRPGGRLFHNTDFLWPAVTYLSSFLRRRGHTADYVNLFQLDKDKLKHKLRNEDIRTVAITTTLYVTPHPILEVVSFIREHSDTARIIVGGPFVANQASVLNRTGLESVFRSIGADYYVINREGEAALAGLLAALKDGSDLDAVGNIAYPRGEDYVFTAAAPESNALEENRVDYRQFPGADLGQFVSLRTAKSCPFTCAFCGFPARAGEYTYMDVAQVEAELNALSDLGTVTTLTFLDDTFNVPKVRFKQLLRMMIRNKYGFRWNSFYRADHGDEEAIELMRDSGCEGVFLGAESGSDAILKNMNKSARRHNYMKAIPLFREAGITTYASFIVGFPGETQATVQETIDLIEEARPDFFRGQLWYADPMTPVWKRREEFDIQGMGFAWSHATMDSETACDVIDAMFLAVRNSRWMPQWGFELWSVFYLQRLGMTLDGVKAFVDGFNAVIKDRLRNPSRVGIPPALRDDLERSCQFEVRDPVGVRAAAADRRELTAAAPSRLEDGYTCSDLSHRDFEQILTHLQ